MKIISILLVLVFLRIFSFSGSLYCQVTHDSLTGRTMKELSLNLENGTRILYTASFPALRKHKIYPLVLALHFGGEVVPYFGEGFLKILVEPAFLPLHAIIIAPDCLGHDWTDTVSEKAVMELLDSVIGKWPVDAGKIVLTGYSMGGNGCWSLAQKYPNRFSAIIPLASNPPDDMELRLPAYVIHGMNDDRFPFQQVKEKIEMIRKKGGDVVFVPVKGLSHYQTPRYVKPLQHSIRWLKKVWKDKE